MEFGGKIAVITGAASGIGRAVAAAMAHRDVGAMALVDMGEAVNDVAAQVNTLAGRKVAHPYRGDVTDEAFRASVYDSVSSEFGPVTLCVPAAGITRDDLVAFHRETYGPEHLVLAISGDVDTATVLADLERRLAGWSAGSRRSRTSS